MITMDTAIAMISLVCNDRFMADTREPRPGEKCAACGQPAVIVYRKLLGDVPTCQPPKPIEPPPLRPRLS